MIVDDFGENNTAQVAHNCARAHGRSEENSKNQQQRQSRDALTSSDNGEIFKIIAQPNSTQLHENTQWFRRQQGESTTNRRNPRCIETW